MFPPENPDSQPVILKCWFWTAIGCTWHEGRIEEASADSQTALITPRGTTYTLTIDFRHIRNVSLAYGYTGRILESFGSPRTRAPYLLHSLPAATYSEVQP